MTQAQTYTKIGRSDFEQFLADEGHAAEQVDVPRVKELVYDIPTSHDDYTVRVFSTLDTRDGAAARDAGSDAIRTLVWNHVEDRPVDSATRTHRIQTWRDNLAPKIEAMLAEAETLAAELNAEDDALVAALEALPAPGAATQEIEVADVVDSRFGRKLALDSPYAAKDAIKAMDWDTSHHTWNSDDKRWEIDADAIQFAADALADEGWTLVAVDSDTEPEPGVEDEVAAVAEGDEVVVHYEGKNNGNALTKTGVVGRVGTKEGEPAFQFRRDDGQSMRVHGENLETAGSYHPYVGRVTSVEVR